ncbi:MAG: hypothetical protein J6570_06845, partial [Snodgrassella sp.]|nr:hypothetical protein [Snodgrassella sp.]
MKYSKLMLKSLVIAVSIALTACNEHRDHLHVHATNTGGKLGGSGAEGTPPIPSPKPELPLPVDPSPEPVEPPPVPVEPPPVPVEPPPVPVEPP